MRTFDLPDNYYFSRVEIIIFLKVTWAEPDSSGQYFALSLAMRLRGAALGFGLASLAHFPSANDVAPSLPC